LLKNLSHVDLVVGTQKFHRVADYVDELVAKKTGRPGPSRTGIAAAYQNRAMDDLRFSIVDIAEEPGSQSTIRDQQLVPRQATAFVSIMQGCNMHCTFCIVPQTRGAERSRSIDEIVREVRALVANGVKEVTLLGQIVNLYGRHEFPWRDFASCDSEGAQVKNLRHKKSPFVQLLEAVNEIEGLERLRFTSPHPIGFREDLIEAISRLPKLAEHVHLPLQSGSNRILKAMHRTYTAEKYVDLVRRIRHAREGIAITTDIIVGFPGETDDDYKRTRDLVEELQFDNAFVFRYSPRRDTLAAEMRDQIDERIKEERNQDLLQIVNESTRRSGERLVGHAVPVLCEGPSKTNPTRLMGRTRTNKIVVFEGNERLIGEIVDVQVQRANGFSLYGAPLLKDRGTF
jgi:tRNA-2-methylthio-N6-dimethylallyladenosine synthase